MHSDVLLFYTATIIFLILFLSVAVYQYVLRPRRFPGKTKGIGVEYARFSKDQVVIIIEYAVEDTLYRKKVSTGLSYVSKTGIGSATENIKPFLKVGEEVTIKYKPSNPQKSYVNKKSVQNLEYLMWGFLGMSIVMFILSLVVNRLAGV